jgi:hypothetical protein
VENGKRNEKNVKERMKVAYLPFKKSALYVHVHIFSKIITLTVMRSITTFRSTTDRIYDCDPIRLYYNTIVLQLPAVLSTATCCTGL